MLAYFTHPSVFELLGVIILSPATYCFVAVLILNFFGHTLTPIWMDSDGSLTHALFLVLASAWTILGYLSLTCETQDLSQDELKACHFTGQLHPRHIDETLTRHFMQRIVFGEKNGNVTVWCASNSTIEQVQFAERLIARPNRGELVA
jgi:hypothetical protein